MIHHHRPHHQFLFLVTVKDNNIVFAIFFGLTILRGAYLHTWHGSLSGITAHSSASQFNSTLSSRILMDSLYVE